MKNIICTTTVNSITITLGQHNSDTWIVSLDNASRGTHVERLYETLDQASTMYDQARTDAVMYYI